MQTEIISNFAALEALQPDWDRLWEADLNATCFSRFSWVRASWRSYGSGRRLQTAVVRDGNGIAGILPLVREGDTLRFLGDPRSDYNDLLCRPQSAGEVVRCAFEALVSNPPEWRRCVLRNVPKISNLFPHLAQLPAWTGCSVVFTGETSCPHVDLGADREAVLKEILRKKSLLRHEKDLARLGPLRFRHIEDRGEIQRHLAEFYRQHIARRALAGTRSLFLEGEARAFYEALVSECDPRGELRFGVVEVGDHPVAYHLGFEAKGVFVWYKPSFDVDYWEHSPGEVLLKRLFEYVRDQGLGRFDFTIGNESFKSRFANGEGRNVGVEILPPGLGGRWRGWTLKSRRAVRAGVARLPFMRQLSDGLRDALETARGEGGGLHPVRAVGSAGRFLWRRYGFDQVTVVLFEPPAAPAPGSGVDVEMRATTLSELTRLAEAEPAIPLAEVLATARTAQRAGDRLYTAWVQGRLACIVLAGRRTKFMPGGSTDAIPATLILPQEMLFLSGYWRGSGQPAAAVDGAVLRFLAEQTKPGLNDGWAACTADQAGARAALTGAGYRSRGHLWARRALGSITWTRAQP